MCKLIIVGNWKMNKVFFEVISFVEEVKGVVLFFESVDLVVCVFVLFLDCLVEVIKGIDLKIGV